ncbi:MAG TPA: hypothetical protein VG055_28335 [Planctomycetaceae bacterium]|jgi:hypothetical protein|nr:hypothetical protein [Planctomycetaceae bacterium]
MSSWLRFLAVSCVAYALLAFSPAVRADILVPAATTAGTLVFTPGLTSSNFYVQSEVGGGNTNGAPLSFEPAFKALFGDVGQFGLATVYVPPGYSGPTPPTLTAWNHTVSGPVAAGTVAWAVDDYKPGAGGPANASNVPFNSLFRGPSITVTSSSTTVVGNIVTLTISGDLNSDGFIHWFNPATPPSSLASLGVRNDFPFTGTFTDNFVTDPNLTNFTGTSTIFADLVSPEPASLVLLVSGLVGPIGLSFYRKRSARSRAS